MKYIFYLVVLVAVFFAGILFYKSFSTRQTTNVDTSVIVQRIEKVLKLVSVEGTYSELINYQKARSFNGWDIPGFGKSALVQVNGKVAVGYNLKQLKVEADAKNKIIKISNLPPPEILYLETDYKYFNIDEGVFTSLNKEDLSEIDSIGKRVIRNKAIKDQLIKTAEQQSDDLLKIIADPFSNLGWKVVLNGSLLDDTPNTNKPPLG